MERVVDGIMSDREKLILTVKCSIDAREKGIYFLRKEYNKYKRELLLKIRNVIRPIIRNGNVAVFSQQKWKVEKKLGEYLRNLPLHPMPFHNQSVWIEKTEREYFRIHFKNKQLQRGQDIICNLVVPKKYCVLLSKVCGKNNSVLGEVELIEDNQYARFNVHIKLRLPKPESYEPRGWVGVDVGWNCLAVSSFVTEDQVSDVTFHGKDFKTRILQLKYLLKQYQRSGRGWNKWNYRLKNVVRNAVGTVAKEIVKKAEKCHAGVVFEDLHFRSHTKRFLIPRFKLKCAIQNLCERKGVPFKLVNAKNTSVTCNKCGHISRSSRNGKVFKCVRCGYGSNADFNASVNIARQAF